MKNLTVLILVVLAGWWLWNTFKPSKYIGFYYPNAGDLMTYKQSFELDSLEQCRDWVDDISGGRTDTGFDYECGNNCKLSEDYKYLQEHDPQKISQYNLKPTYVCDETLE